MRLSLRVSVAAAIGVSLLLLFAVSAVSYRSLAGFLETEEWVRRAHEILDTSHRLRVAIENVESEHRGYALSGDRRYLTALPSLRAEVPPLLVRLRELTSANPSQQRRVRALEPLIDGKLSWSAELARMREKEGLAAAVRHFDSNRGKLLMDQIVYLLQEIEDEKDNRLAARLAQSREDARRTARTVIFIAFAGLLVKLGWVALIDRGIRQREKAESGLRDSERRLELAFAAATEKAADLGRAVAQLEAANKELESFSYSVSHDLRAPLRLIDGFSLAVLEDCAGKLPAESAGHLELVRAASQRMAQLIDDMLEMARVSRVDMRMESVDLSALAEAALKELAAAEPERKVSVAVTPGLRAEGDARLLRLALTNLIGNAWKFTSKTPSAHIEFAGFSQPDGTPAFYVRDNGAGFDPAYAGKLFGAFQRLHNEFEFPGTGVGLATVRRIVHRHGGRVWAESAVSKGASFYFTIPKTHGRTA